MKKRIFFFTFLSFLFAGDTGKITGKITDNTSGESLIGVNVVLITTTMGTATNKDGDYSIIHIPAAKYTVSATYIGYKTVVVRDVIINANHTTKLNFSMEISAIEGDEITVEAERPIIVRDQTATTITMEEEKLNNMPINSFQDAMTTMAGVVENENSESGIHFRGGRTGEVTFLVDGFVVEDALYGEMGMDISQSAISELSVITGAFNAEYGEAMSGVVNIVTKEGRSDYSWNVRGVTDNFLNTEINDWDQSRIEGSLSGPLLPFNPDLATFFISADRLNTRTSLWKNKLPFDVWKDVNDDGIDGNWVDLNEDGIEDVNEVDTLAMSDINLDGMPDMLSAGNIEETGAYRLRDRYNAKLVLRPVSKLKLTLGYNQFSEESKSFSMSYRQLPDRSGIDFDLSSDLQIKASYAVSENMYITARYQDHKTESWNGYEPLLNPNHELESKIINIPEGWDGYTPETVPAGEDYLWLGYYAEPFADMNGDGVWSVYSTEWWNDENGNGVWDNNEPYSDWNNDSTWNVYNWSDDNGNNIWDSGEAILSDEYWDIQSGATSTNPGNYDWGVDARLREGDAYDNTSNYEFYGRYNIYNIYGDSIREGVSTMHDYTWYKSNYNSVGGDLTWQVNKQHQIKAGFEQKKYDLARFAAYGIGGGYFGNSGDPSFIMYEHQPESQSWYIQDKIEYNDVVVNIGLRMDKLDPKSNYPDPTRELGYYYSDGSETVWIEPSDVGSLTDENANNLEWGYLNRDDSGTITGGTPAPDAEIKSQFSPRLGIGYPITDKVAFHFSYGHFYQFPDLYYMFNYGNQEGNGIMAPGWSGNANTMAQNNNLYGNSLFPFPYNLSDWYIPEVGSPNVSPQRSVQYEMGLRAWIGKHYVVSTTLYYKDLFDYAASRIYDADPQQYAVYENMDYANSRGFEISLEKLFSNNYSWYLNYAMARAEGNAPNSSYHWDVAYLESVYGWRDYNRTFTMDWDQTHTINLGIDYQHPKGFGINILGNVGSGLPYTPTDSRGRPIDEPNSGRMPPTANFNMKAFYDLPVKRTKTRIFMDITNLFNYQNVLRVFGNSGQPDVNLNPNVSPMYLWRPYYYSSPRHIEIGLSVGM